MKVLLCTGRFYMGGIEKYVQDLAINLSNKGVNVTLLIFFYTKDADLNRLKDNGVEIIILNGKNGRDLKMIYSFAKILRNISPDIVHLNILPLFASVPLRFFKGKVIYTIHQMDYLKTYDVFFKNCIDGVIAVSENVKTTLQQKLFLSKSLWKVIHNGIQIKDEKNKISSTKKENINLLMVSRLSQDKRPESAIEILNYLNENSTLFYTLTLVGAPDVDDMEYMKGIEDKIVKYNLQDRVFFRGWQTDVFPFLKKADGFLMLSRKESFGYNVLEAMSVGLPIFSFTVEGGLQELHQHNVTGIMIENSNPIDLAKKIDESFNTDVWKEFSENAFSQSKKFSIDMMTDRTLTFYNKLLEKK